MIISPLLLQLGVHPQVAAATSTFVVLLSTSVAALTFGLAGLLRAQPAALFGVCCFSASLIGVLCISSLIRRTNKVSLPRLRAEGVAQLSLNLTKCNSRASGSLLGKHDAAVHRCHALTTA